MALGSTHSLTEISTGVSFLGKGGRCIGLTAFSSLCADCLEIIGAFTSRNPKGLFRPVQG